LYYSPPCINKPETKTNVLLLSETSNKEPTEWETKGGEVKKESVFGIRKHPTKK